MADTAEDLMTPPATEKASVSENQQNFAGTPSVNVVVQNQQPAIQAQIKTIDKNVFTWVFCFLLGGLGIDRFVRGQVGTGIMKLLLFVPTLGLWALIDWIIALVKAYGGAFGQEKDFTFVNGKYAR